MPRPLFLLSLLLLAGCQRAGPYDVTHLAAPSADKARPSSVPSDYQWQDPGPGGPPHDTPILFVHIGRRAAEWRDLPAYWNEPVATGVGAVVGAAGLHALSDLVEVGSVRIKVPAGLPDPTPYLPRANPPTRSKWELGRRLFFDASWLTAEGKTSCATCHSPATGFADTRPRVAGGYNTPTLINCAYNSSQFWDGRVHYLEEVVQWSLDDEKLSPNAPFRHAWGGVIGRLRASDEYQKQFRKVFGTEPTQDALGQAVATYLRTLLAGDSLFDRVEQARAAHGQKRLSQDLFAAALDEGAVKELGRSSGMQGLVAEELFRGYSRFSRPESCAACHPVENGLFTDGKFHNVGVGLDEYTGNNEGARPGRFAVAPLGEKDRWLIGAYRTPTLRSLLRTAPYFHNGQEKSLKEAVRLHVAPPGREGRFYFYLAPELSDGLARHRDLGFSEEDFSAVALFLRALNGTDVDQAVGTPPRP